jgi:hypothetical protein
MDLGAVLVFVLSLLFFGGILFLVFGDRNKPRHERGTEFLLTIKHAASQKGAAEARKRRAG